MGDQVFYKKNNHSDDNGRASGDPLFGKGTSSQIISEAKASVYRKQANNPLVSIFILSKCSTNISIP
jgi:hypothetical protein